MTIYCRRCPNLLYTRVSELSPLLEGHALAIRLYSSCHNFCFFSYDIVLRALRLNKRKVVVLQGAYVTLSDRPNPRVGSEQVSNLLIGVETCAYFYHQTSNYFPACKILHNMAWQKVSPLEDNFFVPHQS